MNVNEYSKNFKFEDKTLDDVLKDKDLVTISLKEYEKLPIIDVTKDISELTVGDVYRVMAGPGKDIVNLPNVVAIVEKNENGINRIRPMVCILTEDLDSKEEE